MTCALHGRSPCPLCDPPESLEDWIVREARAISGPTTHLQDPDAVIRFGMRVAEKAATAGGGPSPAYRGPAPAENMAIDEKGGVMPYSPEEVRAVAEKAVDHGDLVLGVFEMPSGDLAATVFVPPSQKLLEILETLYKSFARVVKGH
jgi:hypothetical protein